MSKQTDRIESFREMEDGWLKGGGTAPTELAITRAIEFSKVIHSTSPSVFPREDGGIGFEWSTPEGFASVEFSPDDSNPEALYGEVFVLYD